ncbi:hypothetical protein B0H13DRAFT_2018823, partial [Mycena leptocephala]
RVKMGRWEISAGASKTHVASRKFSSALRIRPTPGRFPNSHALPPIRLSAPTLSAHIPLCLLICLESIVGRIAIETEPSFLFRVTFAMSSSENPEPLKVKSRLPGWRNTVTRTRLEGGETEAKLDDKNWDYRLGYRSGWLAMIGRRVRVLPPDPTRRRSVLNYIGAPRRGRDIRACAGGSYSYGAITLPRLLDQLG